MASIKKFTQDEMRLAKKAGFKRKKPKKPKASSTLSVQENYVSRYNAYVDEIKRKAKDAKKKEAIRKQIDSVR